jgi:hypothetical protein
MAEQFVTDITKFPKRTQQILADNAKQFGITAEEYLIQRGGLDPVTRKYGDSYDPNVDLTPAEYSAAIAGKTGEAVGKAINVATEAKAASAGNFPDPSSPEAAQLYEKLKGRATGGVKPNSDEQEWLNNYLIHRSNIFKGLQTAGNKLTPAQEAEKNQLINIGVIGDKPYTGPAGSTTVTTPVTGGAGGADGAGGTGGTGGTGTGGTGTGGTGTQLENDQKIAEDKAKRTSAYNILYDEFNKYGLGSLVSDIKNYLIDNSFDPSEFSIQLQNTEAYQNRFSANKDRIAKGLSALRPYDYIKLEDQYQRIMQNYGLPKSYWEQTVDPVTGVTSQKGFTKLIANDVDNIELEDRIATAQKRVVNSNPEVLAALKKFYPDIKNGDILAYVLDPENGKDLINRKITTAEIGGSAARFGLTTNVSDAAYLERYGVNKAMAEEKYAAIGSGLQRGSQLAAIYGQDPYTQATAETEFFKLPNAEEARKQRQKITGLEQATFSGKTGVSSGALARDRAGGY